MFPISILNHALKLSGNIQSMPTLCVRCLTIYSKLNKTLGSMFARKDAFKTSGGGSLAILFD
jgi:hypothetical protein